MNRTCLYILCTGMCVFIIINLQKREFCDTTSIAVMIIFADRPHAEFYMRAIHA